MENKKIVITTISSETVTVKRTTAFLRQQHGENPQELRAGAVCNEAGSGGEGAADTASELRDRENHDSEPPSSQITKKE